MPGRTEEEEEEGGGAGGAAAAPEGEEGEGAGGARTWKKEGGQAARSGVGRKMRVGAHRLEGSKGTQNQKYIERRGRMTVRDRTGEEFGATWPSSLRLLFRSVYTGGFTAVGTYV